MKFLMVSNLYPPYYRGGYELHCAAVATGLRKRGHDVTVLTSTYGLPVGLFGHRRPRTERIDDVLVHRVLGEYAYRPKSWFPAWTIRRARAELEDFCAFVRIIEEYRPDVVNWWSMNGLSKTLLPVPRTRGIPDVHCIDDPWMVLDYGPGGELAAAFWKDLWDGAWGPRIARPLFRRLGAVWERHAQRMGVSTRHFPNRPVHICFQSRYLEEHYREAGLRFASSEVISGGVNIAHFLAADRLAGGGAGPLRVLYAGQLSRDRGVHTAVEAIAGLDPEIRGKLTFTIVGAGDPDYESEVRARVTKRGIADRVFFRGKVHHSDMPPVYQSHDVLVFTSTRPEGQGFTMVEAMLAGCAVLTTGSGGAMDVAEAAGLPLFPKGDAVALGRLLQRLVVDRAYLRTIAARGQQASQREFGADLMIDRLEAMLLRLVAASRPAQAALSESC